MRHMLHWIASHVYLEQSLHVTCITSDTAKVKLASRSKHLLLDALSRKLLELV